MVRVTVAAVALLACWVVEVRAQAPAPHPKTVTLVPVIQSLLDELDGASVSVSPSGLEARFRVQAFQVHTVFKDGTIAAASRTVDGPNKGGFLLKVHVQTAPAYLGPVMLSAEGYGSVNHPYWSTQVREIKLPGGREYAWVTLAQGGGVDQMLISELHSSIHAHMTADP